MNPIYPSLSSILPACHCLLIHSKAVIDVPCCLFVDELIAAYPEAKIILNVRDANKWLQSMQKSLFTVFNWRSWRILRYTDPSLTGRHREHDELIWRVFCGNDQGEKCRQAFINHNYYVQKRVPPERLLTYEVSEGWEPLCRFLDVPVPHKPFPFINSSDQFLAAFASLWRLSLRRSIRNALVVVCISTFLLYGIGAMF